MPVIEREEMRAGAELGAAQNDTVREISAGLSSFKGIVRSGIALLFFGLAFHPARVQVTASRFASP
jgi:hypothetical protein